MRRSVDALFFTGLWLLYGLLINSHDLQSFTLQQAGIEAIVERGRFAVDGSPTPQLQRLGDVFTYDGRLYAAKQPGQFLAGAVPYAVLHAFGLSYAKNYLLVAGWVTFWTAALATALAALCVLRLARAWANPSAAAHWPWLAALTFGVGSTALPYAGVAHHDALATASLTVALCLAWRLRDARARAVPLRALAAGALLGWTITTSMLAAPVAAIIATYAAWQCPRLLPALAAGTALGVAPLLIYNWTHFGHPFLVPNVAGQFSDTYFFFDWANFWRKAAFYTAMLTAYVPIAWCGIAGLFRFPARLRREQCALIFAIALLLAYVLNIETFGGCQYGPRYLLPAMPVVALGLLGLSYARRASLRRGLALAAGIALACSAAINLTGALYGAMYCDLSRYAFAHYLSAARLGITRTHPLALWLVVPLGVWLVAVVQTVTTARGAAGVPQQTASTGS